MVPATLPEFDQLLADIFTTALEGGINYWSQCANYHWSNPDGTSDLQGFYADVIDVEDDDKPYRIDRSVMLRGYERALDGDVDVYWSASTRPPDPTNLDDIEDYDYDAGDADIIVQLGLFGKVVYG